MREERNLRENTHHSPLTAAELQQQVELIRLHRTLVLLYRTNSVSLVPDPVYTHAPDLRARRELAEDAAASLAGLGFVAVEDG
jgi:hypothetical protein